MSSLSTWFGFAVGPSVSSSELPDAFLLNITQDNFVKTDTENIFVKILTDAMERTHGLTEEMQSLLWDNCIKSSKSEGLITMLARAMVDKKELFLVYEKAPLNVIREATQAERSQIEIDYKTKAESSVGVYISFKNFTRSDMIKLYSALEYCTINALNKDVNLASALQFKMKDMRGSTALTDKASVEAQALAIATALSKGKNVSMDKEDEIVTADLNLDPIKGAIMFLNQKRAFYLGMPASYINGELAGGLADSGQADTKAVERGLKNYFFSIIKPVMKSIFGVDVTYKSQDFQMIDKALSALQTFSLVDEELISADDKKRVIDQLFDFDTEQGSDR